MQANGSGVPNEYDKKSFIKMLRQVKKAFEDGFDILVSEGVLNVSILLSSRLPQFSFSCHVPLPLPYLDITRRTT